MSCNVLLHSCTVPHCNRRSARVWLCCTNIILPAQHSTEPYRTTPLYYWALLKCTALYCTVLGRTNGTTAAATQTFPCVTDMSHRSAWVRLCTVLCSVLYCTMLYCTAFYCTVLYCTVLYRTVRQSAVLCCTVQYYCTEFYCTAPCCL